VITRLLPALLVLAMATPALAKDLPLPAAWHFEHDEDYQAGLTDLDSHGGKTCGYIKSGLGKPSGFGDVNQTFKADRYRGKELRWTVWYKPVALKGTATLYLRVDGPNHEVLSYGRFTPGKASSWRAHADHFKIPARAEQITIGVRLEGEGAICFDDMKISTDNAQPGAGQRESFER
jgi:hypothetical protein